MFHKKTKGVRQSRPFVCESLLELLFFFHLPFSCAVNAKGGLLAKAFLATAALTIQVAIFHTKLDSSRFPRRSGLLCQKVKYANFQSPSWLSPSQKSAFVPAHSESALFKQLEPEPVIFQIDSESSSRLYLQGLRQFSVCQDAELYHQAPLDRTESLHKSSMSPSAPMAYTSFQSTSASLASCHSQNPLAAIYASYVVRVHTRHGIKTLSFDHLAAFFTLTAKKAAEDLGISSRTLIRVCRSLGIRRWPYLGFRSEKNVERIRQEAIENLRRKLEKEGFATATAVLHPNASSLRGASAKRLLQVKLPQGPMSPNAPHHHATSPSELRTWTVDSIDGNDSDDDSDVDMSDARPSICESTSSRRSSEDFHQQQQQSFPLLTPQPTHSGFNLEVRSISPRKPFSLAHAVGHYQQQNYHNGHWAPKVPHMTQLPGRTVSPLQHHLKTSSSASSASPFGVPTLNLLVDASILTAFKNEMKPQAHTQRNPFAACPSGIQQQQQQQPCPRSMSMRDILSHTAMAA